MATVFEPPLLAGTCSLIEDLDKRTLVILRDGKKIVGVLRSFDQFANIVLEGAAERIIVGSKYHDVPLGLYIIRGENVVLVGSLDEQLPEMPSRMQQVTLAQIQQAQREEQEASELHGMMKRHVIEFLDLE